MVFRGLLRRAEFTSSVGDRSILTCEYRILEESEMTGAQQALMNRTIKTVTRPTRAIELEEEPDAESHDG